MKDLDPDAFRPEDSALKILTVWCETIYSCTSRITGYELQLSVPAHGFSRLLVTLAKSKN